MMRFILCVYLITVSCLGHAFVKQDSTEKWVAIHLLGYDSDAALEGLAERIPALAKQGINLIFLEVDYHFEFVSYPELRQSNEVITKQGAADFAAICKKYGIRLVPEFQSLGHQSWAKHTFALLTVYPELDLTPNAFPNNEGIYCREWDPYNPKVNEIVFALIDEILEAFDADGIHLGMDEVFLIRSEHAPSTKDKDPATVFAKVVNDFHDYFTKKKGKQLFIWADRLIDGTKYQYGEWESSLNGTAPAVDLIPKDVVLCDWHYEPMEAYPSIPMFLEKGFKVLPCSFKNTDAVKSLISYSYRQDHPNMMGHLFTTWSVVPKDSLLLYPPLLQGTRLIKSGMFYQAVIQSESNPGQEGLEITLSTGKKKHSIRYTVNGEEPSFRSALYTVPFNIETSCTVKTKVFDAEVQVGDVVEKKFVVHKGIGKDILPQTPVNTKYEAKDGLRTLLNGVYGSSSFSDGQWVGYDAQDMEVIIDLGRNTDLSNLSFNSLNDTQSWVHHADKVEIAQSGDGRIYNTMLEKTISASKEMIVATKIPLNITTRYLKISISRKTIPAGFEGAGSKAWLFVDELILD